MPALIWACALYLLLTTTPAAAHGVSALLNSTSGWSYDPWLLSPLYLTGIAFYVGVQRIWNAAGFGRGVRVWQVTAFWTGWLVLALAITSPLHWLGERVFSAHMIEHELIMLFAAPLIAYARINGALLWSLPRQYRPVAGRLLTRGPVALSWRALSLPRHRDGSSGVSALDLARAPILPAGPRERGRAPPAAHQLLSREPAVLVGFVLRRRPRTKHPRTGRH